MDKPTAHGPTPDTAPPRQVPTWLVLALLFAASMGLRLWVIARTEVAARDSVGYVRYALRLEREPLKTVLLEGEQPPGYPIVIMLVSWPVRAWRGDSGPETMVLSCQLASALMALLSIVPTVLLGRELGGRQVGWIAAGLFLCLPTWLRLTRDGLSEGTYLFWLAMALWLGVRGLRQPGVGVFAACGLSVGAAYLTRPEGLEVAVAVGAVLLGRQLFAAVRQPWRRAAPQMLALGIGACVLVGPYAATIGGLTNKNTGRGLLGVPVNDPDGLLPQYGHAGGHKLLAAWFSESGGVSPRWAWAARSLTMETFRAFEFFGLALALIGLAVFQPRGHTGPARAALVGIIALHALILCRMASLSGYLSERHTLLFVFAGSFPAAAAVVWLGRFVRRVPVGVLTCGLMIGGLLTAGPALLKPLHYNRAGHKAAGRWLAKNATDEDGILDPFCWAEFYAGRIEMKVTTERPDRLFVVVETSDNQHSRLPLMADARNKAAIGAPVYHWPEKRSLEKAQVVVYAVPRALLPDPAVSNPRPQYHVGVRAASPTAAAPPTVRGELD
jgi:hypothetical protein